MRSIWRSIFHLWYRPLEQERCTAAVGQRDTGLRGRWQLAAVAIGRMLLVDKVNPAATNSAPSWPYCPRRCSCCYWNIPPVALTSTPAVGCGNS
jgi:hypothetical protein